MGSRVGVSVVAGSVGGGGGGGDTTPGREVEKSDAADRRVRRS
jgi:hypothetical protein